MILSVQPALEYIFLYVAWELKWVCHPWSCACTPNLSYRQWLFLPAFFPRQRPGIFNSPFRPEPHEMEHVLRQVRYHAPNRLATKGRSNPLGTALPATPNLPGTQGSSMVQTPQLRGYCRPPLPPIAGKKKQVRPQQTELEKTILERHRRKVKVHL